MDAIVYAAEVGVGSAGIVVDGQNFLCAYQFAVKVFVHTFTPRGALQGNRQGNIIPL